MMYRKVFLVAILALIVSALPLSALAAPPQQDGGEDYVVQAGDTLAELADRFYGDAQAYPAIVEATNQMAATDDSYANISDPGSIEVGQKLYIPSAEEAAAMLESGMSGMSDTSMEAAMPEFAPVPETAYGPPIDPEKGYFVEELSDGLYWLTEGAYTLIFLTTGEGVIVVDAPPSIGENLLNAIAEVTDKPITHVIYSHSHADHIGAAGLYPEDATYIAQTETAAQLDRSLNDPNRVMPYGVATGGGPVPLPTVTFDENYTLEVGDQVLELEYRGANHEPGNIYVYAPKQRTLMLVDVIFPGWSPFKDLALAEEIPGYLQAHDEALSFDFDTFIGGHLGRPGTREDVEIQKEYMQDIQVNAAQALQTVDFFAIAQEVGFANPWVLFDTYFDAVAQECADLTEPGWVDRLGGVDVFTFDHCFKMMESLRID
jgi:glyoxylase-like metal-dependent hydrolase (beta-lactamase superfamily II)